MKRILSGVLASAMLLALCACGGGNPPAETTPGTDAPAETGAAEASTELNIYMWQQYISDQVVSDFEEANNCTVNISYMSDNADAITKLTAGGGQEYDLIMTCDAYMESLIAGGYVEELDLSRLDQVLRDLFNSALAALSNAVPQLVSLTSNLVSIVVTGVLALVFSIYMLSGKDRLLAQCRRVLRAYTPPKVCRMVLEVTALTAGTFSKFVTGQITEACILGGLTFAGMVLLRLDYPLLIAVLIGVSALVPIVGAYVGAFTSALLLVMVDPIDALIFLIFLVCLQQIEGNVIYPRVVGTSLGLPGIWVLTAVTVGGGLFDLAGVLLSVPVASILYTLLKRDVRKRLARQEKGGQ